MNNIKFKTQKAAIILAAAAMALPLSVFAGHNEQRMGMGADTSSPQLKTRVGGLQLGDLSNDHQYVFIGGESGWQLRQVEYRFIDGKLTRIHSIDE